MKKYRTQMLLAVVYILTGWLITACAMQPDPKYAPDKYFDQPYRSAAAAIWQGDLYLLKKTFKNDNLEVDHIGEGNWSLLLYSVACPNPKAMRFLLDQGADPSLVNPDSVNIGGETVPYPIQPVAYAASMESSKYLKTLLREGGDPNSKYSTTPALHEAQLIHRADRRTSEENMELLLEYGADIEGREVLLCYLRPI